MAVVLGPRLIRFLLRIGMSFEPLAPTAISYFLSRKFNEFKQEGLIGEFKIRTKRLGKFHYRIEVDLDVDKNQTHHFFAHMLPQYSETYRRWINV